MKAVKRAAAAAVLMTLVLTLPRSGPAQPPGGKGGRGGAKGKTWDQVVDAGVGYLKTAQAADGTWSRATHPGITGMVLIGLLRSGKVAADDPVAAKGLTFVESLVDAKEGHIAAA